MRAGQHHQSVKTTGSNDSDLDTTFITRQELEGVPYPFGATYLPQEQAWNFALRSKNAAKVTLLFYAESDPENPLLSVELNSLRNKSGAIWHCRIPETEIPNACFYAYKIDGPHTKDGRFHSFDKEKIVLDPYARSVYWPPKFSREAASIAGANDGKAPLGVLMKESSFDWEGVKNPVIPNKKLIIYEMHVRGFTKHSSSGISQEACGTFEGVIEKIPYLKKLGINAVELMPIFQFDPQEKNYWGYMPINFFTPHNRYCRAPYGEEQRNEFKGMVKELHRAGIKVILDVVFNHTGESGLNQPQYSFKGIGGYYMHPHHPKGSEDPYLNFTGCGNTLDSNTEEVQTLIVESLKYWIKEMHVDGFRFDLASIHMRRSDGSFHNHKPPIFNLIESVCNSAGVILIAEPWDAAGGYHLGRAFSGESWFQWNALYRDTAQRFIRGDGGLITELMARIYGSSNLFPDDLPHACRPFQSVNFVVSHDGSSKYDLVSYIEKRNLANGENNRDGSSEAKWNCGHEGDENVPDHVKALRKQQIRNFFTLLFLSNGTPMFKMGDEFLHTQKGNNNPYNQDNEINWLNWDLLEENRDNFKFVRSMIDFRNKTPSISSSRFWRENISWFGTKHGPDYSKESRCLAYFLDGKFENSRDIYVMINGDAKGHTFNIQKKGSGPWRRVIDTSLPSSENFENAPNDIVEGSYYVPARSIVVLVS
ncbi:MAG: glycogen debranching protein [Bdellovibrionota bacterium]|jgi:isoamylase